MSGVDVAGFAAYARDQIRAADVLLAKHHDRIGICACGRFLPCSAAISVAERRRYFVERLAMLTVPAVVRSAPVSTPLHGETVHRSTR